jgi:hypothetical protein
VPAGQERAYWRWAKLSEPSPAPAEKATEAPPTEAPKPEEGKEEAKPVEAAKREEKKEEVKPAEKPKPAVKKKRRRKQTDAGVSRRHASMEVERRRFTKLHKIQIEALAELIDEKLCLEKPGSVR